MPYKQTFAIEFLQKLGIACTRKLTEQEEKNHINLVCLCKINTNYKNLYVNCLPFTPNYHAAQLCISLRLCWINYAVHFTSLCHHNLSSNGPSVQRTRPWPAPLHKPGTPEKHGSHTQTHSSPHPTSSLAGDSPMLARPAPQHGGPHRKSIFPQGLQNAEASKASSQAWLQAAGLQHNPTVTRCTPQRRPGSWLPRSGSVSRVASHRSRSSHP